MMMTNGLLFLSLLSSLILKSPVTNIQKSLYEREKKRSFISEKYVVFFNPTNVINPRNTRKFISNKEWNNKPDITQEEIKHSSEEKSTRDKKDYLEK